MGTERGDTITAPEAFLLTGLGREQLMRLVHKGRIPGQCIHGRWVLDRAAVEAFARERKGATGAGEGEADTTG